MRNYVIALGVIVVCISGFLYWYNAKPKNIGSLNIYSGTAATLMRDQVHIEAITGTPIEEYDRIIIPAETRVAIILNDGGLVRLEAGSEVEIGKLEYKNGQLTDAVFKLHVGRMWSRVNPLQVDALYAVETPNAVATVRGTTFNSDHISSASVFFVREGLVGVNLLPNEPNELDVREGHFVILRDDVPSDFDVGPQIAGVEFFDEWINFNLQEDTKIENLGMTESVEVAEEVLEQNNTPTPAVIAPPKLTSLFLYGNKSKIRAGEETRLLVRGTYSDNSIAELPFSSITWIKSEKWGSITDPGYFGSNSTGTTTITAQIGGIFSNSITIVVEAIPNPTTQNPPREENAQQNPNTYYEPQ